MSVAALSAISFHHKLEQLARAMDTLTFLGKKWTSGHVTEVIELIKYMSQGQECLKQQKNVSEIKIYFKLCHQVSREDDESYSHFDGPLPQCNIKNRIVV